MIYFVSFCHLTCAILYTNGSYYTCEKWQTFIYVPSETFLSFIIINMTMYLFKCHTSPVIHPSAQRRPLKWVSVGLDGWMDRCCILHTWISQAAMRTTHRHTCGLCGWMENNANYTEAEAQWNINKNAKQKQKTIINDNSCDDSGRLL